jgi:acyl-CoA synthetase (NDP forming)
LDAVLPATASVRNPVDMIASATAAQYEQALNALLRDARIDAVLVIFIPPMVTAADDVAGAVKRATSRHPGKPVLAVCMSTAPMPEGLAPVPGYRFPEAASIALARAASYSVWRQRPEGRRSRFDDIDADAIRQIVDRELAEGGGWLPAEDALRLIEAAGMGVVRSERASTEHEAAEAASRVGYPAVLKAAGPDIIHKTELGAVRLDLAGENELRLAWRDVKARLGDRMDAAIVQPMLAGGVEMLVGIVDDEAFGHVLTCATGGTLTEVIADREVRLYPLTDIDAEEMVSTLRGAVLLDGYRGRPPADRAALVETLRRLSALIDVCPEIRELDINPLVVLPTGVSALDARVRVSRSSPRPFSRRVDY